MPLGRLSNGGFWLEADLIMCQPYVRFTIRKQPFAPSGLNARFGSILVIVQNRVEWRFSAKSGHSEHPIRMSGFGIWKQTSRPSWSNDGY